MHTARAATGLPAPPTVRWRPRSDAEISYRKPREIEADYARDPLLATALCLRATGAGIDDILAYYDTIRLQIDEEVERLANGAQLSSAAEIMAPIAPRNPARVAETVHALSNTLSERGIRPEPRPRTLAESINATLDDLRPLIVG